MDENKDVIVDSSFVCDVWAGVLLVMVLFEYTCLLTSRGK